MSKRTFTLDNQHSFAALSGDWNPLHVDPLAARRSQFGRPVVHGMHLLLWSLEQLLPSGPTPLVKLSCTMRNPVGIDEQVSCRLIDREQGRLRIVIEAGSNQCATVDFETGAMQGNPSFADRTPDVRPSQDLQEQDLAHQHGVLPLEMSVASFGELFPRLSTILPAQQVAVVLATTRLVGMECPGLHSIYSELSLAFSPSSKTTPQEVLSWQVARYDERFKRLTISIAANGASGAITAMLRPGPQSQPTSAELRKSLSHATQYADQRALVVGGSRGLGELCAKLLAVGGADVRLSYLRGRADAEAVVADIRASGGKANIFEYDILGANDALANSLGGNWVPSHVYYFATPPIFAAARGKFSSDLFAQFCQYYVDGFYSCYQAVRQLTSDSIKLFYPSTVAVETIFPNMGEYGAAKSAGENLCKYIELCDRKAHVKIARLPRLPSDQTLSLVQAETESPIETMLVFLGESPAEDVRE
jgi:NADP-dependent 3-hydroxy acid dehydrogenase YdfG